MSLKEENLQKYKIKLCGKPEMVLNDYKKTGLYVTIGINCTGKCWKKQGLNSKICQNWEYNNKYSLFSIEEIIKEYYRNPFISCYILTGMEPFDNFEEMLLLISEIRISNDCDIVIYSGYNKEELEKHIETLKKFKNIIIKFGIYAVDLPRIYDDVLGIELISSNQYAKRIEDL